jgi:hypothetical protein
MEILVVVTREGVEIRIDGLRSGEVYTGPQAEENAWRNALTIATLLRTGASARSDVYVGSVNGHRQPNSTG